MVERFEREKEGVWRVGEVRTIHVRDENRGVLYVAQYTVTEDLKLFGPCNERWIPLTTPYRHPSR